MNRPSRAQCIGVGGVLAAVLLAVAIAGATGLALLQLLAHALTGT